MCASECENAVCDQCVEKSTVVKTVEKPPRKYNPILSFSAGIVSLPFVAGYVLVREIFQLSGFLFEYIFGSYIEPVCKLGDILLDNLYKFFCPFS